MNKLLMLVGGALLLVALVFGVTSVSHAGVPCGSAFGSSDSQDLANTLSSIDHPEGVSTAGCDGARSDRKTLTLAFGLPGLLLLGAGGFVAYSRWQDTPVAGSREAERVRGE